MQDIGDPAPFQSTPPQPGQEAFLYTYVLLKQETQGIIGFLKVIGTYGQPDECINDYKRAEPTNKQCPMKWNETGTWVPIRRPETDLDGTIDIVRCADDEPEEFMGEKLVRENFKENKVVEDIKDRASMDSYKTNLKVRMEEEKRIKMRKQAMEELQAELDDPKSLASYAQLHWKRLAQKSSIAEYREKIEEAQAALLNNIKELRERKRLYPHYETQWQNEIRRIQTLMAPKQQQVTFNANLGEEDDLDLAENAPAEVEDEFDAGVGVELKGKKLEENIQALEADVKKTQEEIGKSFLPSAPTKRVKARKPRSKKK